MNSSITPTNHVVAVYSTHDKAEAAIKALNSDGFDMRDLSVVGQNYATDEQPLGFVNTGDRMLAWGKIGVFWGSIWGLLFGSAMIIIPGVGPLFFAGWLISMLEGAAVGGTLAAFGGALAGMGIPKDTIIRYETHLKAGSFLVLARGSSANVGKARDLLANSDATQIDSFGTKELAGVGA